MRVLVAVLVTAFVTFWVTNLWARFDRDENYAKLLWAKCPHLILEPHHPERAFIEFMDGSFVPIMPRRKPAGVNPSN